MKMVGEEEVTFNSDYNDLPESKGEPVPLTAKENFDDGPHLNFGLENARRDLIAKRVAAGADTPIGHRCSNLIEQLEHYRTAEGDQRASLAKSIERSLAELAIRHQ